ncbi:MAG TPA: baseplate J/gp47 family protein [Pseudomonas sp.]|uniref:baseplate assembly protein n=1 Tax=Pseudomonas sp. TaxID=306 RepID=UPI002C4E96A5|nr:baseplate J/gp47 family protein [Pseudomonas sp.]HTO17691.1 baseplate J/gp47 family protein [Pseudomonas sp.]
MTTVIDLSGIPAPNVIEPLDYEQLLDERKAHLISLYPEDQRAKIAADLELESEPLTKLLQENAYRELILRQRINEGAQACMLPYAKDGDLDNLVAFEKVTRLLITPANPNAVPPTAAVYESDADLLRRYQLALEAKSKGGTRDYYRYHALTASGQVLDADALSPLPGRVVVHVLSRADGGLPSQALLDQVQAAVTAEDVRILTDYVTVQPAVLVDYSITATLYFEPGPYTEVALTAARTAVADYAQERHRLGLDVSLSGLYRALHQPGVRRVELTSPAADLIVQPAEASRCISIELIDGGVHG